MVARYASLLLSSALLSLGPGCGADPLEPPEVPEQLAPGTKLSVNPSIELLDETRFAYVNAETKSAFTASLEQGTYRYERKGDVGRLTLNGKASPDGKELSKLPATLELTFVSEDEVSVSIAGQTYRATITWPD